MQVILDPPPDLNPQKILILAAAPDKTWLSTLVNLSKRMINNIANA
jgi:hypothetical protein